MSSFTTPLDARFSDNGTRFTLLAPFVYEVGSEGSGEAITVPVGFETDLASVPKWARPLFPITGKYTKAAVLHDWLWNQKGRIALPGCKVLFSKYTQRRTNEIFLEAMEVLGVPWLTRTLFYRAVEWFPNRRF